MDKLLQPVPIVRDSHGLFTHPDLPQWGENDHAAIRSWMADQGMVGFVVLDMFDGLDDLPDEDIDRITQAWERTSDISEFPLLKPEGDDWFLLSIHDTEDGPVAWWVTRSLSGTLAAIDTVGHGAPPRPIENEAMLRQAVGEVVREMFDTTPLQWPMRLQHILDLYIGNMTGFELATELSRERGWNITSVMIEQMDGISSHLAELLRQAERDWVTSYQIQPPLAIGQRVRIQPTDEAGTIVAVNHDGAGYYLIHLDGETRGDVHSIVAYESARLLEAE